MGSLFGTYIRIGNSDDFIVKENSYFELAEFQILFETITLIEKNKY